MSEASLKIMSISIALCGAGYFAAAQAAVFPETCAARDVQAITLIEDRGEAGDVPQDSLGQAGLDLIQARCHCYAGRVREGLALYDKILRIASPLAQHKP